MNTVADILPPVLVVVYMLLSIIFRWRPEIPLAAAFLFMVATGITFALGAQDVADHFGFTVLYLLVAGSILLIVKHLQDRMRGE